MAEASLPGVQRIADAILDRLDVKVLKPPTPGMVMVRQVDPLENTPFLLGEAYVTECEVEVDGLLGYGCTLGAGEQRALCAALVDAVIGGAHGIAPEIVRVLEEEEQDIQERWATEAATAAATRVSFDVR
ncbi:MAG TPA: phosphonate C-P lyase system protein PhnG [Spirochaetia bacterium]|nr:phosphonate C-P lyase system protein PhnG [Spirochaetia bacterium]